MVKALNLRNDNIQQEEKVQLKKNEKIGKDSSKFPE